jgi:cell division septation protein DedD
MKNPAAYRQNMFIFGGRIISLTAVAEGSLIEAFYAPVDYQGNIKSTKSTGERFLAVFPSEKGILDQMTFHAQREITIAGEFTGLHIGQIDNRDYIYPVFEVQDIHVWGEIAGDEQTLVAPVTFPVAPDQVPEPADAGPVLPAQQDISRASLNHDETQPEVMAPESPAPPEPETGQNISEELTEPPEEEQTGDSETGPDALESTVSEQYYVQVGSWKNSDFAQNTLNDLRRYYPDAYIYEENNFFKLRIPDVKTREMGVAISQEIEKRFSIKSIVVLRTK